MSRAGPVPNFEIDPEIEQRIKDEYSKLVPLVRKKRATFVFPTSMAGMVIGAWLRNNKIPPRSTWPGILVGGFLGYCAGMTILYPSISKEDHRIQEKIIREFNIDLNTLNQIKVNMIRKNYWDSRQPKVESTSPSPSPSSGSYSDRASPNLAEPPAAFLPSPREERNVSKTVTYAELRQKSAAPSFPHAQPLVAAPPAGLSAPSKAGDSSRPEFVETQFSGEKPRSKKYNKYGDVVD